MDHIECQANLRNIRSFLRIAVPTFLEQSPQGFSYWFHISWASWSFSSDYALQDNSVVLVFCEGRLVCQNLTHSELWVFGYNGESDPLPPVSSLQMPIHLSLVWQGFGILYFRQYRPQTTRLPSIDIFLQFLYSWIHWHWVRECV